MEVSDMSEETKQETDVDADGVLKLLLGALSKQARAIVATFIGVGALVYFGFYLSGTAQARTEKAIEEALDRPAIAAKIDARAVAAVKPVSDSLSDHKNEEAAKWQDLRTDIRSISESVSTISTDIAALRQHADDQDKRR
jgi:hypothetical protein